MIFFSIGAFAQQQKVDTITKVNMDSLMLTGSPIFYLKAKCVISYTTCDKCEVQKMNCWRRSDGINPQSYWYDEELTQQIIMRRGMKIISWEDKNW